MSGTQDFVIQYGILKKYKGPGGEVAVPDGVTEIGDGAFEGCTGLTRVSFPDSLTTIEDSAFSGCTNLTQIVLPKHVRWVYSTAFSGCVNLTQFQVDPQNPTLYTKGSALYRRDNNGTVLVSWPSARGAVSLPGGIVTIGFDAFHSCTRMTSLVIPASVTTIQSCAFKGCKGLTQIALPKKLTELESGTFADCSALEELTLPQGVTRVDLSAFDGCTSLKRVTLSPYTEAVSADYFVKRAKYPRFTVEPKFLRTTQKLSPEMAGLAWVSDGEDLAYAVLYQGSKTWQKEVHERVAKARTLAADVVSVMTDLLAAANRPKKAEWERATALVLARQKQIGAETLQAFYDLAREKQAPVLPDLERDSGLRKRISMGSGQEEGQAAQLPENPVERLVVKQWKVTPTVKKLQKLVKQGVRYAGSKELCSREALIWLVAFMADAQADIRYKAADSDRRLLAAIRQNLDPIAAGLDRTDLMEFLDIMVFSGVNAKLFIPTYCRYADEEQMEKLVRQMKEWHQWSLYGASGRNHEECVMDNLYFSETKAAMRNCDLRLYAKVRGTDEQTLRDTVLADLGLDREGRKCYDLGGKTVEARMEDDLTVTLYDPEAGKAVKSMPKKGADPEKYEAAKKDFARLKKDIRAAVKERTNLLFQRFLDGEGQKGEAWKKVYFQNPMLNQIARLLVWSQGEHTFTMTLQGTADAAGQPCEVGDEPVKVAHPMEMKREDLERWQKYFTSHNLKQPFAQVWEPIVDFSTIRDYQYEGLTLPANQLRSQEKHGIYFNYDYQTCVLETHFADLNLACGFTEAQDHFLSKDAMLVFGTLKVKKKSRAANHVLARLDKWMLEGRVRRDDATVVEALDHLTVAQVTELLNQAIKYHCTGCTAALLEYKNQRFPDFDPMDAFTLE